MKQKKNVLLFIAVLAIAMAMRAAMGSVGPLTSYLIEDLNINSFIAGFLTTIPMICFAVSAIASKPLIVKLDTRILLIVCLFLSVLGPLVRSYCGKTGLFVGTLIMGVGIGILNVFMPAFVRQHFEGHESIPLAAYSAGMIASSALSSGTSSTIKDITGSWQFALCSPAIVSVIAIALCLLSLKRIDPHLKGMNSEKQSTSANKSAKGKRLANLHNTALGIYLGFQAFFLFSLMAWLPTITKLRIPEWTNTGILITLLQICSFSMSFVTTLLCKRIRNKALLGGGLAGISLIGFIILTFAGSSIPLSLIGTVVFGIGSGSTYGYIIYMFAMAGESPDETAKISSYGQCIAYVIAAFGPTGMGFLNDLLGNWNTPLIILIFLAVIMTIDGVIVGKTSKIKEGV